MSDDRRTRGPMSVFYLAVALLFAVSACSPAGSSASNVDVTSTTVDPQGQLALHATATFEVSVRDPDDLHEPADLRYHWSLAEERGTYLLETGEEVTEAITTSATLRLRGDVAGAETVRVTVVDSSTDSTIGVDTLPFDIAAASSPSSCFKDPTLFVTYGYPPTSTDTINVATGERKNVASWLIHDVSPDGNWFVGLESLPGGLRQVFIQHCDGTGREYLTSGDHYEDIPKFSPDGLSVYFRRRSADENVLYPGEGMAGFMELWVVDIASGDSTMLTELNPNAEGVKEYAISPDGETIVFEHVQAEKGSSVLFVYDSDLVTMPAGGGPLHKLAYLGDYNPVWGLDWSPDGKDIIFSWDTNAQTEPLGEPGIYRVHPTAGSAPELILLDPSLESLPPKSTYYYSGGTRIAWAGQEYGQTTGEVWSVDANGGDVKQLTFDVGSARLLAVWEP